MERWWSAFLDCGGPHCWLKLGATLDVCFEIPELRPSLSAIALLDVETHAHAHAHAHTHTHTR